MTILRSPFVASATVYILFRIQNQNPGSFRCFVSSRVLLGDTSQILITMFIVYNSPSFHLAYILICYCLAPTLFRVVASTHTLYLIITGTPLLIILIICKYHHFNVFTKISSYLGHFLSDFHGFFCDLFVFLRAILLQFVLIFIAFPICKIEIKFGTCFVIKY